MITADIDIIDEHMNRSWDERACNEWEILRDEITKIHADPIHISGTHFATSNRAEGYYFVQPFESRPFEIRYYRDGQMYDNQHCRNGAVPAGLYHMIDPNVIVLPENNNEV